MHARHLFLLILLPALAHAGAVFRCVGADGEPAFGHRPCDETSSTMVRRAGSSTPAPGLRAGERAWLAARERSGGHRGSAAPPKKAKRAAQQREAAARRAYQCQRRRHQLDAVHAELRRGYKPAKGERLRRRRQAHEDYLAAFCS